MGIETLWTAQKFCSGSTTSKDCVCVCVCVRQVPSHPLIESEVPLCAMRLYGHSNQGLIPFNSLHFDRQFKLVPFSSGNRERAVTSLHKCVLAVGDWSNERVCVYVIYKLYTH